MSSRKGNKKGSSTTRIAVVKSDRCKPNKCRQECKKGCPVVHQGKLCVEVTPTDKLCYISEGLCTGCGMCVKKCPFNAISIINLPSGLKENETTHRYSANSFKLHRLPVPRTGKVLGLVGTNGIGKSTALKILAGILKPNLGRFNDAPDWQEILNYYRGSELQNYFKKIVENNLKAVVKTQHVNFIREAWKGTVQQLLNVKDDTGRQKYLCDLLDLNAVLDREVSHLSGGELQRFAIALCAVQKADVYMFDEPSSYLDVRQRLNAAKAIRSLLEEDNYVIVVEHDLSVLDYLSDFICCLYGVPGAYGVVTMPSSVREGINIFLDGFIPSENMRFRQSGLTFKVSETADRDEIVKKNCRYRYGDMKKKMGNFELSINAGEFTESEIVVMLGENGTGKTTFIKMLAGKIAPDSGDKVPELNISYKPQQVPSKLKFTVADLLANKIRSAYSCPQFNTDVMKPLMIEQIKDQRIDNLSGGELQRVALAMCLGKPADVYLIDEPSAYLDSEQRIIAARVIKRHIMHSKKTAFIVEHDFIMGTYLADSVIVFGGIPSVKTEAMSPKPLVHGFNDFLRSLSITFRRDPKNYRPRINKENSLKDSEQKQTGRYFFLNENQQS